MYIVNEGSNDAGVSFKAGTSCGTPTTHGKFEVQKTNEIRSLFFSSLSC